ncbi:inositol monophosphatase [Actibacterium mucosum KCTC 23349]|uniref:Inositol monophosphatase n=1 Tax=Actibacterium mucosum KCTC 23349 TaxID=1454373 RepID=A0A037ZPK4_9RHOB|nr:3'(2'),5'-bisphosphate nucleotidase CysQ [Actibacterium mucosum]KAJ57453.1 inositol monophosphatase [Actibacterium mucosum KCTC 23349]
MPARDLALLVEAAKAAGEVVAPFWRHAPEHWDKPDAQGPVSEADLAVDACLRDILLSARPDYGWISEESVDERDGAAERNRSFIIDPIDGTRSFLEGARTFAHSLAIAENGRIIAGVVFLPMHDRMFQAAKGGGAFLNETPLRAGAHMGMDGADILAARPTLAAENWDTPAPAANRHYRASLAYRMALVAQGRFDAMITLRPTWFWDIAAGTLIAEEAGAEVRNAFGDHVDFADTDPRAAGIVVANPTLRADIHARLSPTGLSSRLAIQ